jgi:hypothetical protein
MRLFRTIASAHGGRVFANMGAAFNLSDELAAQVVRYFVPPIVKAITRRTQTSQGLLSFLDFLGTHRLSRHWDNSDIFSHPDVEKDGQAVLVMLFPQVVQVRRIVNNRARVLPVDPYVLEGIFPYVAVLALAAIEMRTRQPLFHILEHLAAETVDETVLNNPHEGLAEEIRRRHAAAAATHNTQQRSGISGIFGSLFSRSGGRPDRRSAA